MRLSHEQSAEPSGQRKPERRSLDFWLVFAVALGARLAHAGFVSRTPFFEGPVIDSDTYLALARHIEKTGDFGGAFYQPPLYPSFLALLLRVGLSSAWQIAIVQSVLGACTALVLVAVGRRLARDPARSRAIGLLTGLAAALYGPLVLFDVDVLPPCCVNLLLVAALWLSLRTAGLGMADTLLGLLLGLGAVAWPLSAALSPALIAIRARALQGQRLAFLALVAVTMAAPLAVTAAHNARHDARGVVVSYNLGINLWLGNNAHWRDTWRARPGARFEPELERPDREGVTRPGERSDYFVRLVLRDLRERPVAAVSRTVEKFYYVWFGPELRRDQDIELLREASPLLRSLQWEAGLYFPFGLLAPLGLLGLWRRRHEQPVRWLGFGILAYGVLLAVFFVSSRYRLPLVLLLLPFAAEHALYLVKTPTRPALVAALALTLALNLPSDFSRTFAASPAERGVLEARSWRNQGNFEQALSRSTALVARFAGDPDVRMLHAEHLVADGRCHEAEPHLRKTIELAPRTVSPRLLLAECLADTGKPSAAERELASALALHPFHPLGLKRAAGLYLRARKPNEARVMLERFVASGYRDAEVSELLARLAGAT